MKKKLIPIVLFVAIFIIVSTVLNCYSFSKMEINFIRFFMILMYGLLTEDSNNFVKGWHSSLTMRILPCN